MKDDFAWNVKFIAGQLSHSSRITRVGSSKRRRRRRSGVTCSGRMALSLSVQEFKRKAKVKVLASARAWVISNYFARPGNTDACRRWFIERTEHLKRSVNDRLQIAISIPHFTVSCPSSAFPFRAQHQHNNNNYFTTSLSTLDYYAACSFTSERWIINLNNYFFLAKNFN